MSALSISMKKWKSCATRSASTSVKSLSPEQLDRKLMHPETGRCTIRRHIGLYAWHGEHHLAHLTGLLTRNNWQIAVAPSPVISPPPVV